MLKWLMLLLSIAANASASVLVKLAMLPPRSFPSLAKPAASLMNWPFWLGLALYGIAFLLYAAALAKLPLHIAHPILTSGAMALVAALSALLFHEPFHWSTVAGIGLVMLGVVLIAWRAT